MILSKKQITKVLISLRVCTEDRFSRVAAYILYIHVLYTSFSVSKKKGDRKRQENETNQKIA